LQRWRRRAAMGAAQAPAHAVEGARQPGWREERRPEDLPLPLAVGGRHGAIKTAVVPLRKARNPRKTGVCRVRQLGAWVCRHAAVRPFDPSHPEVAPVAVEEAASLREQMDRARSRIREMREMLLDANALDRAADA